MRDGSTRYAQYRYVVVSAVVIVLGLQGMAEAQPDLAAYFPLTVGNRWVYQASEGTSTEEWEVIREEEDAFVIQITADSLSTASFEEEFRPRPDGIERLTRSDINVDNRPQPAINRKFQPQPQVQPSGRCRTGLCPQKTPADWNGVGERRRPV